MQTVQLFKSADFGEIRTLVLNSEAMFCLADVCKALDISHVTDVKKRLKEDGVATAEVIDSIGRKQCATFINEPNLYKTIFQSRKPSAERFTDWVTSEVLPSIRKNGIYATENIINQILENPDLGIEMFTKLKEERAARAKAEQQATLLQNENDLLTQEALEWADRPQGWRDFKKELLYRYGINVNARITNHLNNSNSKQKPKTLDMLDDSELQNAVTTAVALCRNECIDISGIIEQKLNRKEEIA